MLKCFIQLLISAQIAASQWVDIGLDNACREWGPLGSEDYDAKIRCSHSGSLLETTEASYGHNVPNTNLNNNVLSEVQGLCDGRSSCEFIAGNTLFGDPANGFAKAFRFCGRCYTLAPTPAPTDIPTSPPTLDPTNDPTFIPTVHPTKDPTIDPTKDPTSDPTVDPTAEPTSDPTIDPTADPTFDPTKDPTTDPTHDPTADPTEDPTFDPTEDPTIDPTYDPTSDPTLDPTYDPTSDPTIEPTQDPTYDPIGNISYQWTTSVVDKGLMGGGLFIHDAYSKFEVTMTMELNLLKSLNKLRWEYIDLDTPNLTNLTNWTEISKEYYKNINIYTAQIVDIDRLEELGFDSDSLVYSSVLTISAIRTLNSGYCYNVTTAPYHLLQPGKHYGFRLYVVADSIINDRYDEYFYSEVLDMTTNSFVTDGTCILSLLDKTSKTARLLDKFYFECTGWNDPDSLTANFSLKFNGLMNDVLINNALLSESWTDDPTTIIGVIGTKALKIKALVRDDLGAITCHNIDIDDSFPSASISDEEILEAIRRIIRENKLGQDNAIAVALDTILEGLLFIGYANEEVLAHIMGLIVTNVVDSSFATNPLETSSGRVLSESVMMRGLLSEDKLIFSDSASLIVDSYLPSLFSTVDQKIITAPAIELDQSIGDSLNQIGLKSLDLADKLEGFMSSQGLEDFEVDHNKVWESFVEFSAYSGHIALSQSYPGTEFEYFDEETNKRIFTKKIDPGTNSSALGVDSTAEQVCGFPGSNSIRIPPIFEQFYDCSFVEQTTAFFEPNNNYKQMQKSVEKTLSNTVTINFYNGAVYHSAFDHQRRRARRRMQNEGTNVLDLSASLLPSTQIKDRCKPYFITIYLDQNENDLYTLDQREQSSYALGKETPYPACEFWNVETKKWDTNNCFVYNYTEDSVLCACSHLTTFNVKASDFKPKANIVSVYDFRQVSEENMLKYPTVWITLLSVLCVFIVICIIDAFHYNKDNLSPLAYKDIMFSAVKNVKIKSYLPSTTTHIFENLYTDKHNDYGVGLIKSIRKDNKLCTNQLRLYKIYLYDNHTLLSVFQHSEGTNYSKRERIASFYLYLCTIMVSSAAFYGVEQQKFGDITASFLISLWSTVPALFVRFSFKKAKPNITPVTINIYGINKKSLKNVDLSKLPTNVPDNELSEEDMQRYNVLYSKLEAHSQFKFVDKAMMDELNTIIIKSNHKAFRMVFLDRIRAKLLLKDNEWPHFMKMVAWTFLILWCLMCSTLAIVYGVQFDLKYNVGETGEFTKQGYREQCYDMNPQLLINEELSAQQIERDKENLNNNFGAHIGDSSSWLLQLFQSVILSIFLWQPLTVYFITWVNIWLFSWNLPISLKPPNLIKLFKNVFNIAGDKSETEQQLNEIVELTVISRSMSNEMLLDTKQKKNTKTKERNTDEGCANNTTQNTPKNSHRSKSDMSIVKTKKANKKAMPKPKSPKIIVTDTDKETKKKENGTKPVSKKKRKVKRSQTMSPKSVSKTKNETESIPSKKKRNKNKNGTTEEKQDKTDKQSKKRNKRAQTMAPKTAKKKKEKNTNTNSKKKTKLKQNNKEAQTMTPKKSKKKSKTENGTKNEEEKEQKQQSKSTKSKKKKPTKTDRTKLKPKPKKRSQTMSPKSKKSVQNTNSTESTQKKAKTERSKNSKTKSDTKNSIKPRKKRAQTMTPQTFKKSTKKSDKKSEKNGKQKSSATNESKIKQKTRPFQHFTLDLTAASKQLVVETIIRYKTDDEVDSPSEFSDVGFSDDDVDGTDIKYESDKKEKQKNEDKFVRGPSISPFTFAVEKSLNNVLFKAERIKSQSCIEINESETEREKIYKNIVSHRFRPFDVYAFFGTKKYFLEIVNTWYGLDIKGYEREEPVSGWLIVEEEIKAAAKAKAKYVAPWHSAVGWAD